MAPIQSLLFTALAFFALVQFSIAAPSRARVKAAQNEAPCETVDKYTTQWFLDNALTSYKSNLMETALFYSRGMSAKARDYASARGLITIWDVWPCPLYRHHNVSTNPMRCIHNTNSSRTTFYENMSRAFALKASGSALVMHSFDDYDVPPQAGIWGRIEFPTLKDRTNVKRLTKLNEDASRFQIFWQRLKDAINGRLGSFNHPLPWRDRTDLKKRGYLTRDACMLPQDYAFFEDVEW